MGGPKALVIVPRRGAIYVDDFAEIARHISRRDPHIRVRVVHEESDHAAIEADLHGLPALTVCFDASLPLPAVGGRRFSCRPIIKTAQLRQYAEAGIAYPRSAVFRWGMAPEPQQWGPLLVLKPLEPSATSKGTAHLIPTPILPQLKPLHFAADHPIHESPMLVQSFIDTGEHPSHFRVLILFGEPLYAVEHVMDEKRPPLDASPDVLLKAQIATNGAVRVRRLINDPEIIDFARRMAASMPAIPLHGVDIVREQSTGRLLAIENNPGGNTWHFSSVRGDELRQQVGLDALLGQFGGLERAAEILAGAIQRYARN